jgi:hypothetical protein
MLEIFKSWPVWFQGTLVLTVGTALILFFGESYDVCNAQAESLIESQKGAIFPGKGKKKSLKPLLPKQIEICKLGNSSGACFEMFETLSSLMADIRLRDSACNLKMYEVEAVQKALAMGTELIVQLAWFSRGADPISSTRGWLGVSEVTTFCQMINFQEEVLGPEEWGVKKNEILSRLLTAITSSQSSISGGAKAQPPDFESLSQQSLFSIKCYGY